MKEKIKNMSLFLLLGLFETLSAQKVSINYGAIVWGQLNLTKTVGYEDDGTELVSVAIIRYDTIFSDQGKVEAVNAKDFVVKVNKEDFRQMKTYSKSFWVHAKWVTKKNGVWVEANPPKDPNRPGKKVCLVFQFGLTEPVTAKTKKPDHANSSTEASSAQSGCPSTPCPEGKVRNQKTCDCEPKSNR